MNLGVIVNIVLVVVAFTIGFFSNGFIKDAINENAGSGSILSNNVTLHVLITGPNDTPVNNLEVDLWHDTTKTGPPDAAISFTNSSGIAVFSIPKGGYLIGFNMNNFPVNFEIITEYFLIHLKIEVWSALWG